MTRDTRIYVRIRQEDKDLIEKAARSLGLTSSAFVVSMALQAARKVKEGKRR